MHCDTCKMPWHLVIDRSYVHRGKSPRRHQGHQEAYQNYYDNSWSYQPQQQWENQGQKAPRAKNRAKSAKGKKKNQEAGQRQQGHAHPGVPQHHPAMEPMMPPMNWPIQPMQMMPPPYMPMGYAPPLPPPETPWQPPPAPKSSGPPSVMAPNFSMPAMPKAPSLPATAPPQVDADLMSLLKQDVAELPPHIQKAVKESAMKEAVKEGAKATRDLEVAAKHLGQARKDYENAILARSQLHSNWRHFLSDAVKMWQDYATQFTTQEKQLQDRVTATKEAFIQAKEVSSKAHDTAGTVQEIDSEEDIDNIESTNQTTSTAAQKITETMVGLTSSLQNLQQQAAALEAEEQTHQAKRPRVKSPRQADAAMGEDGLPSAPFGQAG